MLIFAIQDQNDRAQVEKALGVCFEPHESLYLGGEYWLAKLPGSGCTVRIRANVDLLWSPGDSESERFAYPELAEHNLLLEVESDSSDILNLLGRIPALKLLSE
jgi:hypothetical protein